MPPRRPPRDGPVVSNLLLFAAAIIFLPWLVESQQQRHAVPQRQESPHEALEARRLEATKIAQNLETPYIPGRRKNTVSVDNNEKPHIKNDASAIATLAPAEDSAVAAPPTRQSSNAGLASPQIARSLEDWEVEDFVLLATVDGKLHARDRKTGKERWNLVHEKPMVETKHHRRNRSSIEEDYEPVSMDGYLWIVEPSRDGSLYVYIPGGPDRGLVNTGLTMKKVVEELSPHASDDPYVTYTGEKKTSLVTIDAKTGDVVGFFGTGGSLANSAKCVNSNTFLDKGECSPNATLTIGRTEYTVAIHARKSREQIATLTFSEWSPNNYDRDLQGQYQSTLDKRYIYASHDGSIIGLDHSRNTAEEPGRLFKHKFSSPVVRVFDVARPWGTEKADPELVVLTQPTPPHQDDDGWVNHPASSIFVNHTEDGSWYAMSGKSYPYAVQGIRQAQCNQQGWLQTHPSWDVTNDIDLSEGLVGLHSIEAAKQERFLTISGPGLDDNDSHDALNNSVPAPYEPPTLVERLQSIPGSAAITFVDFIKNPMWLLLLIGFLITNQRQVRIWIGRLGDKEEVEEKSLPSPDQEEKPQQPRLPEIPEDRVIELPPPMEVPIAPEVKSEDETNAKPMAGEVPAPVTLLEDSGQEKVAPTPEKKKAHRGRRGGVKHRKGPRAASESSPDSSGTKQPTPPTVDDAVRNAQNMGQETPLEPDIKTMSSDPTEVSGPVLRIGALEVNTEKLIGTGSNGTMVFEGKFDGREVAVKRMLIQFFDIASQETKLLRESDDHPNVIRYYAQQQAAGFLYIALELCPASLAEVIEKPNLHRELAQSGERDLPNVLYQITNGLHHLHTLRIVHRDLKPQNILVAMGKDGRPRLLVSDFGLCKKLEGEQSSFRATTAHAAGTSGWRAPELLLDDDAKEGSAMIDASTDGNSGPLINAEFLPNRRATRAIDIFSLGLVFFYVLTKGSHPFDCGDRYMREVNIRKGVFNLKLLEVLGDYAFEAQDLIASMLQAEPRARPLAHHVLAHPFFWSAKKRLNFLCDVSDHFEKEKRDPPSPALIELERCAPMVCRSDFLKPLGKEFVESMGKQRKYTGTRLLDLLRALRNKRNHYEDMSDHLKEHVGPLPDGYLSFWTRKFPNLLITCWNVVYEVQWDDTDRFREYYMPAGL